MEVPGLRTGYEFDGLKGGTELTLCFLVGPTAVGKTALSLSWAREYNGVILSCDSLCVYRGMDIGTAKPSGAEREAVEHRGIDIVPVREAFSVADYAAYAARVVAEVASRGRNILVVGGSGFYLKSFFLPVVDNVSVRPETRAAVREIEEREGLSGLLRALRPHAETGWDGLDVQNPRRVARALELVLESRLPLAEVRARFRDLPPPYAGVRKVVWELERPEGELRERIDARVEAMLDGGLVDEVRALRRQGLEENPSAAGAIGYREVLDYLDKGGTREELAQKISERTRQLARKQRAWFRHQIPIARVLPAATATVADLRPDPSI